MGAKESGKTVYMTVLVHELMHRVGEDLNAAISGADDDTRLRFASDYEQPLYRDARLLASTTTAGTRDRAPLVFRFTTEGRSSRLSRNGTGEPQRTLLSFFDTAGEDLRSAHSVEENVQYLAAADGVVLLLDPLQMRGARQLAAPGTLLPTRGAAGDDPANVLENITDLIMTKEGTKASQRISKPLAIVFTKMDALLHDLKETSPLLRTPARAPYFDERDSLEVHTEIQRLLARWEGSRIDQIARKNYRTYRYFGVSALGETPTQKIAFPRAASALTGSPAHSYGCWRTSAPFPLREADMAFQQLYYTSCESGLAGYGGYQFTAVTPGTSPVVMREVEDRSVYEPPRVLLADPCLDEPEAYPIALSYGKSEPTRRDHPHACGVRRHRLLRAPRQLFCARPGHQPLPGRDLGPLLPAELWGAEVWHSTPIEFNELPELPGPLPRGVVDRPGVQAFLDARGTERVLPELLTAVWRAMAGDRLVLLASNDANENIWWIAAVSYLLGEHLAPRMTFTTYTHRPGYSRHHLIGIQSDAVPPDSDSGFQLFDLDAGKTPGGAIHPLANLLAATGVMATDGLWRQASAFASGTEQGPDDWLGPVAAATGLLRGRLSASETDAVLRWLPEAAGQLPTHHASVVLGVALAQPDARLADNQLPSLLDLAHRLRSPVQVERLEHLLVERTVMHIAQGEPVAPTRLSPGAAQSAQAEVSGLLQTVTPAIALAALEWAAASGAVPSDVELERYGEGGLALTTPEPELTRILTRYPAIRRGFLAQLACEPTQLANRVLAGPVGVLVNGDDLAQYPGLAKEWQLHPQWTRGGRTAACGLTTGSSTSASRRAAVTVRGRDTAGPAVATGCDLPPQIADLLSIMTDTYLTRISATGLCDRFQAAAALREREAGGCRPLPRRSPAWPAAVPVARQACLRLCRARSCGRAKRQLARSAVDKGDLSIFPELYADHAAADDRAAFRQPVSWPCCSMEQIHSAPPARLPLSMPYGFL